ncbi:hypothetical protein EIN_056450 [Entamoeba invadens IP1]|uniref:hypothetical protein n=1 Tax=Entamoeba invadens IP1 TaxID=370355 RepID=UPI0002C3E207|nr:hypothetical protein EIN_056450 [Entamoeba invadens IP1]ELP93270.1 hypothetical protein EIN_056450 [Entamoeba invadens IP1]|eukprot:XP_004260041.1 hypothetical protein EIN_056450 [Entamoeba invadens IP1]
MQSIAFTAAHQEFKGVNPSSFKCVYSFREIRNYQSEQECVLLALLNQFYAITFTAHKKQTLVTVPFFRILTIEDKDPIYFKELIERRISERLNSEVAEGSSLKTALRRCENYRVVDTVHTLADMLELKGFDFDVHVSTGKRGTLKAESIFGIRNENDFFLFDQEQISRIGGEVSKYLHSLESVDGVCTIQRMDITIAKILCQTK